MDRRFAAWFSVMPGYTVQLLAYDPPCAMLMDDNRERQPALVSLDTGELRVLEGSPADPFVTYRLCYTGRRHPWLNTDVLDVK